MSETNRAEELIAALRATGCRITPQRVEVCRALAGSKEHPTALALHQLVRKRYPGISQATVYNTLALLRDLGEIMEVGLGQEETHYEPDSTPHANLICVRCGAVEDVEDDGVASLSASIARRSSLAIKAARLDIYGLCAACEATGKTAE